MNRTNRDRTVEDLPHLPPRRKHPCDSLQPREHVEQQRVPPLLQLSEHARLEEDLRRPDAEDGLVELERVDHAQARLAPVHVTRGNDPRGEHLVPLAELDEGEPVRVPEARNADALEHTVAPQLVEHERYVDAARLLVRVGVMGTISL